MKNVKNRMVITSVIILFPMLIGILCWNMLPDTMVTHFGANNEPNGWSSKFFAVIGLPLFLLLLHLFTVVITLNDPKKRNIGQHLFSFIFWIIPVISLVANGSILAYSLGFPVNIALLSNALIGILFLILGNYLSKNKQNYTVGIRLPWTLSSESNWEKTHRLASKIWVVAGLLMIVNAFLQLSWLLFVIIILAAFIPALYSFILYKKQA